MSTFELIDFKEFPKDDWTRALAQVRVDGKYLVRVGFVKIKGDYAWCNLSVGCSDGTSKKYEKIFEFDSKTDDKKMIEFVELAWLKRQGKVSVTPASSGGVAEPNLPF